MNPPLPIASTIMAIRGQAEAKQKWIRDFSTGPRKRPDAEIDARKRELEALISAGLWLKTMIEQTGVADG